MNQAPIPDEKTAVTALRDLLGRVSDGIASDLPIAKEIETMLAATEGCLANAELPPIHDNLRDIVGQAISDAIQRGAPEPDWHDSREIDRLADAALKALLQATEMGKAQMREIALACGFELKAMPDGMELRDYVYQFGAAMFLQGVSRANDANNVKLDPSGAPMLEPTFLERQMIDVLNRIKAWRDDPDRGEFPQTFREMIDALLMTYEVRRKP